MGNAMFSLMGNLVMRSEMKRERQSLRVFSTILNITPPMWRSEVTLMVMGGDSGPKSSTITERSHAAILGREPKTRKR